MVLGLLEVFTAFKMRFSMRFLVCVHYVRGFMLFLYALGRLWGDLSEWLKALQSRSQSGPLGIN